MRQESPRITNASKLSVVQFLVLILHQQTLSTDNCCSTSLCSNDININININTTTATTDETGRMSSEQAAYVSPTYTVPDVGTSDDSRFHMSEATIEYDAKPPVEGSLIQLGSILEPISLSKELFVPGVIYVRKEMCQVFGELTKDNRKNRQILIGSPGVGKSILLFLVALQRVLTKGVPTIFVRKTRDAQEPLSVFFMKKTDDTHIEVLFDRKVDKTATVRQTVGFVLSKYAGVEAARAMIPIWNDNIHLYIDGLHEGDPDLIHPFHYLCTSGGYDSPQGESARHASLVVLEGWSKSSLKKALTEMEVTFSFLDNKEEAPPPTADADGEGNPSSSSTGDEEEGDGEADGDVHMEDDGEGSRQQILDEILDDIFYHTGGRIREVLEYAKDPTTWKCEKKSMIGRIKKSNAKLCIIETKGSGDAESPDRIRTMFRRGDPNFFGDCLQIVDSQFFAHLLQDRCGLEQYYDAYRHAKDTKLSSAAGCHFEELVHRLFRKCPQPIEGSFQGVGTGAEGVAQLTKYRIYWIPSISNFANIDAALLLETGKGVTLWCFQYTVSEGHKFNPRSFQTKFLRPVCKTFDLKLEDVTVNVVFVVPDDVVTEFCIPENLEETGWGAKVKFVDCSNVDTLPSFFDSLDFIDKPVQFNSA